ncbi:MAG: hypothetical protein ORN28_01815, partial [Rhodoferax sp.]|nr:hypothetical protein [Rhodoferax sp.]
TNGYFDDSKKKPDAVFSFYPGCGGWCDTDYESNGSTDVNILYGNDDDWGKWRDSYGSCKSLAGGKIKFHGIPQATHAFDYLQGSGTYEITGAGTFTWGASPSGLSMARQIVAETLNRKWQTTIK